MGYYTYYSLNYNIPDGAPADTEDQVNKRFVEIFEDGNCSPDDLKHYYYSERYGWKGAIDTALQEELKWYDHDDEMIALSKEFPEVEFTLDGTGEESDDLWTTYYKNGKAQHAPCQFVYDEPMIFSNSEEAIRNNEIDNFCRKLAAQWKRYPNYRFAQMICNVFGDMGYDPFYAKDDIMLQRIEEHLDDVLTPEDDTEV